MFPSANFNYRPPASPSMGSINWGFRDNSQNASLPWLKPQSDYHQQWVQQWNDKSQTNVTQLQFNQINQRMDMQLTHKGFKSRDNDNFHKQMKQSNPEIHDSASRLICYKNVFISLETPEDIEKWRNERRVKYPTKDNVQRKMEIIESMKRNAPFRDNSFKCRNNFSKRKFEHFKNNRKSFNRNYNNCYQKHDNIHQNHDNNNQKHEVNNQKHDDHQRSEHIRHNVMNYDTNIIEKCNRIDDEIEDGEIVDDDDDAQKNENINDNGISEKINENDQKNDASVMFTQNNVTDHKELSNSLKLLLAYDSDESHSDTEVNDSLNVTKPFTESTVMSVAEPPFSQTHNSEANDIPSESKNVEVLDAKKSFEINESQLTDNSDNKRECIPRNGKSNMRKELNTSKYRKPRKCVYRRMSKLTLFEKLLMNDIKRNENKLIESLQMIVENNFLQNSDK